MPLQWGHGTVSELARSDNTYAIHFYILNNLRRLVKSKNKHVTYGFSQALSTLSDCCRGTGDIQCMYAVRESLHALFSRRPSPVELHNTVFCKAEYTETTRCSSITKYNRLFLAEIMRHSRKAPSEHVSTESCSSAPRCLVAYRTTPRESCLSWGSTYLVRNRPRRWSTGSASKTVSPYMGQCGFPAPGPYMGQRGLAVNRPV